MLLIRCDIKINIGEGRRRDHAGIAAAMAFFQAAAWPSLILPKRERWWRVAGALPAGGSARRRLDFCSRCRLTSRAWYLALTSFRHHFRFGAPHGCQREPVAGNGTPI
jgi:hypothetical protein